ncbi:crotonase/enoyl-CoA hydratase family protein [Moraxella sp. FZLJ2107]|uniref:crotonase/enoyl-CoA hydratase family protein n=1 Tax=unclassified Moraxella TaxID=2685852 RepID=UPI00209BECB9|nr:MULTISPECIES: crotonase/enoyl-CoA hydratase family protein [unclassified Moraxella]USZ14349.1 crotonase/enoyl-CoA hydratase family protein [Moraxella sp. FZFQ2102]UTO05005.1 crotonase/enoyl-CoA hydratase family protein [Moraxella sp. FZLJ2107]UTO21739.1 crotonase/enoyl-CoA hydratase family protein [Moraxella sp. FZLJ2109]
MTAYQTITTSITQDVMTITLNRPEKKNALSFVMMDELIHLAKTLKRNKSLKAVVITGSGTDFCSGLDLADLNNSKNLLKASYQLIKPTPSKFQQVCLIWQSLPMPVIAVIKGVCVGGGLQLALGADMRIAHPDARFSVLEAKWGLVADMGITHTAGMIAKDKLAKLAMTAEIVDAKAAFDDGLVTIIDDEPMARANQLIADIGSRSPDAVLAAKRIINARSPINYLTLYQEKLWQIRLMLGHNRKLAIKKAKDSSVAFVRRQFG